MTYLQLVIEPDPATEPAAHVELARELTRLLRRDLAIPVVVRSETVAVPNDVVRGDPVAVAALILSIPGAVVAIHDLAARLKLKDCLERVVARARTLRARATWRIAADHIVLPGDRERALDEILDELSRAQDPSQTR